MPVSNLSVRDLRALSRVVETPRSELTVNAPGVDVLARLVREDLVVDLRETLPDAPPSVEEQIEALRPAEILAGTRVDLAEHVIGNASLTDEQRSAVLAAIARERAAADRPPDAPDSLGSETEAEPVASDEAQSIDARLADFPQVAEALRRARVVELGRIAKINDTATQAVLDAAPSLLHLSNLQLEQLVAENKLKPADAQRLGLVASLSQLAGDDLVVAEQLLDTRFESLHRKPKQLLDFLKLDTAELASVLAETQANRPEKADTQAMAAHLQQRIQEVIPLQALNLRLALPQSAAVREGLQTARNVLAQTPEALSASADELGLDTATSAALVQLRRIAASYPALGLESVMLGNASPAAKTREIQRRVDEFEGFIARNSQIDLLRIDLTEGGEGLGALDFSGLDDEGRSRVLGSLRARSRVFAIAGNVDTAASLLQAGYASAVALSDVEPEALAVQLRLPIADARALIDRAHDRRLQVNGILSTLLDDLRWIDRDRSWLWRFEDVSDGLRQLPGYQELLGNLASCECNHCDSILSPAAYFVDLMAFIDSHVSSKVFTGVRSGHALKLENRRPDLWTLPLNCSTTHDLLPTLEIINEILENAIAARNGGVSDLSDRAAVLGLVYESELPQARQSFTTPFDLRVATADRLLSDTDTDRCEISKLMRPDAARSHQLAAALRLSLPQLEMITTPRTTWTYLSALFRMPLTRTGSTVNAFDIQDMVRGADISRELLGEMIESRFVSGVGAPALRIVAEKRDSQSVQNDIERVRGMTQERLDRLHRLYRLHRVLGWDIGTLDVVLGRLGGAITEPVLEQLVYLDRLAQRLEIELDAALALFGPIPDSPLGAQRVALLDRLFNRGEQTGATRLPANSLRFVHPALRDDPSLPETGPDAGVFLSQRLQAAFGIGVSDLRYLIEVLSPWLGANPRAALEVDRGFVLSAENLSVLYRHALLARRLGLSLPSLFVLIRLAAGETAIRTQEQLTAVLDLHARLPELPWSIDGMAALSGDEAATGQFFDPAPLAQALRAGVQNDEALVFAPTLFAFLDGVTEAGSRAIIAANATLFEPMSRDMLRLRSTVNLGTALHAPPGGFPAGVAEPELRALLETFNIRQILPARLAAELEMAPETLVAVARLAAVDLTRPAVLAAFYAGDDSALVATLARLQRPVLLFRQQGLSARDIDFIADHPRLFGLGDLTAPLSRSDLLALAAYLGRLLALADGGGADQGAAALRASLLAHDPASGFAAAAAEDLALALGCEASEVRLLLTGVTLPDRALAAIDRLARIVGFARAHELGPEAMVLLSQPEPLALSQGAQSLLADLRLKVADDDAFAKMQESQSDWLRGQRRDALADHLIRHSAGRFNSHADLFAYYLIDPEMQGCARTSRVVAGIGSLQTYVNRVLLNLEQDRRTPSHAQHVQVSPSRIPASEWEWRKNYRVWEANRKVFLWPENYMLGSLRDDKTPQFEKLEQTLLQQDLSEQAVLDAYAEYMQGFEEMANLQIAGAYHEFSPRSGKDVLHVFGCTTEDPPAYYYWTIENLHHSQFRSDRRVRYSARRMINVAINAREVSATMVNSRLHLFWSTITTQQDSRFVNGGSEFRGYRHTYRVSYSALRLDGNWTPPQALELGSAPPIQAGGVVADPLTLRIPRPGQFLSVPRFSDTDVTHVDFDENYSLRAPAAVRPMVDLYAGRPILHLGPLQSPFALDLFSRTAKAEFEGFEEAMRRFWHQRRQVFHIDDRANLNIYAPFAAVFELRSGISPVAAASLIKSHSDLRRNLIGGQVPTQLVDWFVDRIGLSPAGLGARVGMIQSSDARLIVPALGHWAPAMIIQKGSDAYYLSQGTWPRPYRAERIGTTVVGELSRRLFYSGVHGLLEKAYQQSLREAEHLLRGDNNLLQLVGTTSRLDFTGPMGVYYREIFYFIPMLLAEHLNARGDHAAAQSWLATVFDPTAPFSAGVDLQGLTDAQRLAAERDRVWQYAEFSGLAPPRLRDVLTDQNAQAAYRNDPFNPFAIARLRRSAFQKNTMMRYVGNLLDRADALFSQFTRETVDEAHILYDMALQVLGPRPARAGSCGEGPLQPRTFARLKPHMQAGQDFLTEVETFVGGRLHELGRRFAAENLDLVTRPGFAVALADARTAIQAPPALRLMPVERAEIAAIDRRLGIPARGVLDAAPAAASSANEPLDESEALASDSVRLLTRRLEGLAFLDRLQSEPPVAALNLQASGLRGQESLLRDDDSPGRQMTWSQTNASLGNRFNRSTLGLMDLGWRGLLGFRPDNFVHALTRQISLAFCVPHNRDLLALWDRAEDRLEKIRSCRNINGERVELALFAPEIDPMALVRARAAGLSLSDVLASASGNLPPYRFSYLLSKARDYAGLVQSFGARLQAAIERRDAEEMAVLRATQAADMQKLIGKVRDRELKLAATALQEARQKQASVNYQRKYYQGKYDNGLTPSEAAYQTLTRESAIAYLVSMFLKGNGGLIYLLPQLGAPTAMKYGGAEVGSSMKTFGDALADTAKQLEIFGKLAKMNAEVEKQFSEFKHRAKQGENELKEIEKRIKAAEIRVDMAQHAIKMHEQSVADHEEMLALFGSRFTNLGFYTWLSSEMQILYRRAFNAALSMARLAERAYRFERPQDDAPLLDASVWNAGRAGFGAGERLMASLVEMEKRFIETNYRSLEVSQPFSLAVIAPTALAALRSTGACDFVLPELIFDLFYPGQYRRRIRSVRLTVDCEVGPNTNIPATLTLTGSRLRLQPTPAGAAGLSDSPLRHSVTIATSSAQADTGVLDFSFSDPRYVPFEGAGAVDSAWRLNLPTAFRAFDYGSIRDVVLHISYSAEYDGLLRDRVETANTNLQNALIDALRENAVPVP